MPLLDVFVHWNFVALSCKDKKPKLNKYPVKLSSIVDNAIYDPVKDINTQQMSLSTLHETQEFVVENADINGFDRESFEYSLTPKKFTSGMFLYGILPPSNDDNDDVKIIKVSSSKATAINKAWCAIKDENQWNSAIIAAKAGEYEAIYSTQK